MLYIYILKSEYLVYDMANLIKNDGILFIIFNCNFSSLLLNTRKIIRLEKLQLKIMNSVPSL